MKFVKVCPFCRSKRLESAGATGMRTGSEITDYKCLSCGRTFPPMLVIEADESFAKE